MSEENNRKKFSDLYRWIRGIFVKGEIVTKIECRHAQSNGDSARTHRLLELLKEELKQEPDEICNFIIGEVEQDCKNFSGFQSYLLLYYTEKGGDDPRGRFILKIAGEQETDPYEITGTEPSNEKGLISQMMRHNEALMRITLQNVTGQMSMYERRLESQERMLERSSEREIRVLELIGNLEDRKLERDMEFRRIERGEKVKDKLLSKVDMFMPVLAAKMMPSQVSKESNGFDPRIMSLLGSLDENQMHKLLETLTDDQRTVLFEIYTSYKKAKESEQQNETE